ncbi:MAG: hypothetical protein RIE73_20500 [Coleofasciculus sp. C1-SOL-03]
MTLTLEFVVSDASAYGTLRAYYERRLRVCPLAKRDRISHA